MNKEEFRQAREELKLSAKKFGEELGLKGEHRDRTIRRIEDTRPEGDKFQPSKNLIKNAKILLELHEMKKRLIKE